MVATAVEPETEVTVTVDVEDELLDQVDPVGLAMLVIPDTEDMVDWTETLGVLLATTMEDSEVEATGPL